jgi:hypothetical protein
LPQLIKSEEIEPYRKYVEDGSIVSGKLPYIIVLLEEVKGMLTGSGVMYNPFPDFPANERKVNIPAASEAISRMRPCFVNDNAFSTFLKQQLEQDGIDRDVLNDLLQQPRMHTPGNKQGFTKT